jgi:hypothetical protein
MTTIPGRIIKTEVISCWWCTDVKIIVNKVLWYALRLSFNGNLIKIAESLLEPSNETIDQIKEALRSDNPLPSLVALLNMNSDSLYQEKLVSVEDFKQQLQNQEIPLGCWLRAIRTISNAPFYTHDGLSDGKENIYHFSTPPNEPFTIKSKFHAKFRKDDISYFIGTSKDLKIKISLLPLFKDPRTFIEQLESSLGDENDKYNLYFYNCQHLICKKLKIPLSSKSKKRILLMGILFSYYLFTKDGRTLDHMKDYTAKK